VYEGAYSAQCVEFAKAVLGTGSRAWVSVEVFDGGVDGRDVHRERVGGRRGWRSFVSMGDGECEEVVGGVCCE
jgi:hypothetical protein